MDQTQIAEKLQIIQDGINTEGDLINQIITALEGKGGNNGDISIETCTGLLTMGDQFDSPGGQEEYTCYYLNNNLETVSFTGIPEEENTFHPVKNSLFVIIGWHNMDGNCGASGSCNVLHSRYGIAICTATGDFSMEYMS